MLKGQEGFKFRCYDKHIMSDFKKPSDHYRDLKQYVSASHGRKHICMVYSDKEQQITALSEYFSAGFKLGQRCLYVSDAMTATFVRNVLKRTGMNIDALEKNGSLCMLTPTQAYLTGEKFNLDSTIERVVELIENSRADGFTGLRGAGDSTWVLQTALTCKDILTYESSISSLYEQYPFTGLCLYDETRFHPKAIKMLIQTHPAVLNLQLCIEGGLTFGLTQQLGGGFAGCFEFGFL